MYNLIYSIKIFVARRFWFTTALYLQVNSHISQGLMNFTVHNIPSKELKKKQKKKRNPKSVNNQQHR